MTLPDLPKPDHFTLEQICQRWCCDEERLIQYCRSNMLEIGVILNDAHAYRYESVLGKEHDILNGFFALSIRDVEGAFAWGESPGDEFSHTVRRVYLPKNADTEVPSERADKIRENSEYQLESGHVFSSTQLAISKYERDRFETEHNMHISDLIDNEDSTIEPLPTLNIQEKRELILKSWLAGKKINTSEPLTIRRKELWTQLSEIDETIFPIRSKHAIKDFFDEQTLCKFKPGRGTGG